MTHIIRGEAEVQYGFGLPRHTTTSRLAYTPPAVGYQVFDTDLSSIFVWNGTEWAEQATGSTAYSTAASDGAAGTAGAKIDKIGTAVTGNFPEITSDGQILDSTYAPSDFATAAQGALAVTAAQAGANLSTFTNDINFITETAADAKYVEVSGDAVNGTLGWDTVGGIELLSASAVFSDTIINVQNASLLNVQTGSVITVADSINVVNDAPVPTGRTISIEQAGLVLSGDDGGTASVFDSTVAPQIIFDTNAINQGLIWRDSVNGTNQGRIFVETDLTGDLILQRAGINGVVLKTGYTEFPRAQSEQSTLNTDVDKTLTTKDYVDSSVAVAAAAKSTVDLTDVSWVGPAAIGDALIHDGTNFVRQQIALSHVSDFTEADYVHVTGNESIAGDKTFTDTVTISGDLIISGTTTTIESTNTEITDNVITINGGEVGTGVTNGTAGFTVDRGTSDNENILFDEADDTWKIGTATELRSIATSFQTAFTTADWTAGSPNVYTLSAASHGIPYVAGEVFIVQVYDTTGAQTTVDTTVDQVTGDVTLSSMGPSFDGRVIISK